jgi:flagellar capping protein FliD
LEFWIGRKYLKPPSWIANKENNWEKEIVTLADKIICVNDKMVDEFRQLHTKFQPLNFAASPMAMTKRTFL